MYFRPPPDKSAFFSSINRRMFLAPRCQNKRIYSLRFFFKGIRERLARLRRGVNKGISKLKKLIRDRGLHQALLYISIGSLLHNSVFNKLQSVRGNSTNSAEPVEKTFLWPVNKE